MKRILAIGLAALAAASCSTVDQKMALTPDSSEAIVLVAGTQISGPRFGYGFRTFDPQTKTFGRTNFSILEGYTTNALRIKGDGGASALKRPYYIERTPPGHYVRIMELRMASVLEGSSATNNLHACQRSGAVYPVMPGRVNVIDLDGQAPDAEDIAAFEADYRTFLSAFPNVSAPLHVSRPIGIVEFYGEDMVGLLDPGTAACPKGVSDYRAGEPSK
jgi:hypothetical protein